MQIELPRAIKNLPQPQQRLVLFAVTFLVALLAVLIAVGFRMHPVISVMLAVFGPLTILAFPSGLITFFAQMGAPIQNESDLWFVPFLIYLGILLPALLIKKQVGVSGHVRDIHHHDGHECSGLQCFCTRNNHEFGTNQLGWTHKVRHPACERNRSVLLHRQNTARVITRAASQINSTKSEVS